MSEPFIGEIRMFGFNFAPRGWALCNGQLLAISQNTALFSLIGTIYGGDGRTTFGLPDLRSRVPMHFGQGPGLSNQPIGAKSGTETTTLTVANLPAHNHAALAAGPAGNSNDAISNIWADDAGVSSATYSSAAASGTMRGDAIGNTGGGQAFSNLQPYLATNFCIALVGLFPSRN
jgi:microcystin-dependent protein